MMFVETFGPHPRVSFDVAKRQLGRRDAAAERRRHAARARRNRRRYRARAAPRPLCRCHHDPHRRSRKSIELAEHATRAPVTSADLRPTSPHPCQLMADVMTFEEHKGPVARRRRIAWVGDEQNNMATSWVREHGQLDFRTAHRLSAGRMRRRQALALGKEARREGACHPPTRARSGCRRRLHQHRYMGIDERRRRNGGACGTIFWRPTGSMRG